MPSRDSNDRRAGSSRGPRRSEEDVIAALSDFADTRGDMHVKTHSAFAEAKGVKARAKSREIGALHFAAHVLLLALVMGSVGASAVYFSVRSWISGTVRTPWFAFPTASHPILFNLVAFVLACGGTALLFVSLYFLSRLGASRRERARFAAALPRAFRPARKSLLAALWILVGLIALGWSNRG